VPCCHRDHRPEPKGGYDAEQGESDDFDEVNRKDEPCRGAEAFQGGDGRGLAGDVKADRIANPDPTNQESGEPDEVEVHREAVDQPPQRGEASPKVRTCQPAVGKSVRARSAQERASTAGAAAPDNDM